MFTRSIAQTKKSATTSTATREDYLRREDPVNDLQSASYRTACLAAIVCVVVVGYPPSRPHTFWKICELNLLEFDNIRILLYVIRFVKKDVSDVFSYMTGEEGLYKEATILNDHVVEDICGDDCRECSS